MTETPRPDPWKNVETFIADIYLRDGDLIDVDVCLRTAVDAARAADAAEIATLRATVDQQAEMIRQLQAADARCATLTAALDEISQMLDCPGGHRPPKPPCETCGHEVKPVWCAGCIARAALAAAPQGGTK